MKKHLFYLSPLLLAQASLFAEDLPPPPSDGGLWQTLITIGICAFFFYFILFRPEQKRRQAAEFQRSQIKKGDKVVAMGIVGRVSQIKENSFILKMFDGSKIEVLKGAISDVVPEGKEEDEGKIDKADSSSKKIESIDG